MLYETVMIVSYGSFLSGKSISFMYFRIGYFGKYLNVREGVVNIT